MSESFFPNQIDGTGTQVAGYPGMPQQRGVDQGPMAAGQPPLGYPPNGHPSPSSYGPSGLTPSVGPATRALQPRVLAVVVAVTVLSLGLGAFSFVTDGKLGDAETKAAGLSQSLEKANHSLGAKQTELESAQKELEASQQQISEMEGALGVVMSCATALNESWDALLSGDADSALTAYEESRAACDQITAASGTTE